MPLYYFNIRNGSQYTKDYRGTYLSDLGSVRQVALYRAKKLLAKKGNAMENAEFEIADQGGVLVEAVRFSTARE
jgi:hypothetical protein